MDTRNGVTPLLALGPSEQATSRTPTAGRIAQEANASSNLEDTLTWAWTEDGKGTAGTPIYDRCDPTD